MSLKQAKRYDRGLWILEAIAFRNLRKRLLENVSGKVLEIGIGTGANLPFYRFPESITGIDAHPGLLSGLLTRNCSAPFAVCHAKAEALPFCAGSFDTIVSTLVFCSIPDVKAALEDVRRVLKPGGELLLMEHVRGRTPFSRRLSDWLHPAWFALQGECHLNRETELSIREAGYRIKTSTTHGHGLLQLIEAVPPPADVA